MSRFMLLGAVMLACLPAVARAGVIYEYDDGTAETYGGAAGAPLAWMVHFTVQPGGDTINAVQISLHEACSFEAVVWEDINGLGDPADARVLSRTPYTGAVGLNTVPISPVTVSGSFFVGAYTSSAGYPINADTSGCAPHRSWVSASSTGLDLNDLTKA